MKKQADLRSLCRYYSRSYSTAVFQIRQGIDATGLLDDDELQYNADEIPTAGYSIVYPQSVTSIGSVGHRSHIVNKCAWLG